MAHDVVKQFETHGLRCAVLRVEMGYGPGHHCGYVIVPEGHPWFGKNYTDEVPGATLDFDDMTAEEAMADFGTINVFGRMLQAAANDGDLADEGERIDMRIRVHGGVTFAGKPYFDDAEGWCFGFDCAHLDDTLTSCDEDYAVRQCERMAAQLAGYGLAAAATEAS